MPGRSAGGAANRASSPSVYTHSYFLTEGVDLMCTLDAHYNKLLLLGSKMRRPGCTRAWVPTRRRHGVGY